MICYLDSSALVKLFVEEPGTAEVHLAVKEAELVGTVAISRAEVVAALAKAARFGALSMEDAKLARHRFRTEWLHFLRLQVSDFLIDRAGDLAWAHGLRGYDASWRAAEAIGLIPYPPDLPELLESWKT